MTLLNEISPLENSTVKTVILNLNLLRPIRILYMIKSTTLLVNAFEKSL